MKNIAVTIIVHTVCGCVTHACLVSVHECEILELLSCKLSYMRILSKLSIITLNTLREKN